ncbi:MAG: Ig-like domain-containing protein [Lachnospiraceae bacterium]|nr:Ig-like domain-containing protein [Lachnospiraceae bacterium]
MDHALKVALKGGGQTAENRMKNKRRLELHGKNRRKPVKYTDKYTEDFYDEAYEDDNMDGLDEPDDVDADASIDEDDEYIVAYSSENKMVGAYTSEEMKEYAEEYQESRSYGIDEYEPGEYDSEEYDPQEYDSEEYGELEEYEPEEYDSQEYNVEEYHESAAYDEVQEYETDEYEAVAYDEPREYEADEYEEEAYDEPQEYEVDAYDSQVSGSNEYEVDAIYNTKEIHIDTYEPDDYAEDTESYYELTEEEEGEIGYYESDEYYDDEYYGDESYDEEDYNEDSFDTAYGNFDDKYERDNAIFGTDAAEEPMDLLHKIKMHFSHLTAFDAVLVSTGVVVLVAALVILSMFLQSRHLIKQIEALAPLGGELKSMGIVGGDGLLAMSDAALLGNFAQGLGSEEYSSEENSSSEMDSESQTSKVNVSFVSVEKDLKIRFTDANTGELIKGTAFEVTLTNAKGKKLVLTDDDMDGIIYAQNVNPGVFEAIVTSTDKYTFPTMAQQVTVKDKVEYVAINVQDEVKTEKQVNVAAEDTEKNVAAAEAEVLKDTVEWVESTKTPVSGTESYLLVDKNTIADPSQTSKALIRMLFDTLNVSLDKSDVTLSVGASTELKGTEFSNTKEGDTEYNYTAEWTSSNDSIASVNDGKVTAKAVGTAIITYTVTKKTITTTTEIKEPVEEILDISVEEYQELSDQEKEKCTPIKDDADQIIGYTYKKVTTPDAETKTSETTESASAECVITVEEAKITAGKLELSKSAENCAVGEKLLVQPVKLVYTKQDGSTETITENFPSIAWESDDNAVATVSKDGLVTGVKAGKVHITGRITGVNDADGKELNISSSIEVSITGDVELTISLDRTSEVYIAVGDSTTLVATVTNYQSDASVTWKTSDEKVATVNEKGVVTGVAAGSVTITATTKEKDSQNKQKTATCVVTVNSNAASDTTTKLKDKNGNQIYIKNSDGSYREAVYADYYSDAEFYILTQPQYIYTGWQTIDGKTYFFDKNGNAVTGTQIIQGVTYNFGADGAIATTVNGSTFGIDISRHNGTINWNAVKASGVDYVIIRCGYRGSATGVLIEDESFRTNIKGASAAGLKVGVYVFSQAINEVEAVKEASLAVSLVKGYNLTYPIFIDTESSGGRADKIDRVTRTAVVNAFCQTVASAGYKPGIYASKSWFEDKLNMGAIGNYKIWLAQYSAAPTYKGRYDMWQYSSKGQISGIKTKVDLNYSYHGY